MLFLRATVWVAITAMLTACTGGGDATELLRTPEATLGCEASGNLVQNCGFEIDASEWESLLGDLDPSYHVDDDGASSPGSVEIGNFAQPPADRSVIRQCIETLQDDVVYRFGLSSRLVSGSPDSCVVNVLPTDLGCILPGGNITGTVFTPGASWTETPPISLDWRPSPFDAVRLTVSCSGSPVYVVHIDDVFLEPE